MLKFYLSFIGSALVQKMSFPEVRRRIQRGLKKQSVDSAEPNLKVNVLNIVILRVAISPVPRWPYTEGKLIAKEAAHAIRDTNT